MVGMMTQVPYLVNAALPRGDSSYPWHLFVDRLTQCYYFAKASGALLAGGLADHPFRVLRSGAGGGGPQRRPPARGASAAVAHGGGGGDDGDAAAAQKRAAFEYSGGGGGGAALSPAARRSRARNVRAASLLARAAVLGGLGEVCNVA